MSKTPAVTIPSPTKYQAPYQRPSGAAVRAAAANASRTPPPRAERNAALAASHAAASAPHAGSADHVQRASAPRNDAQRTSTPRVSIRRSAKATAPHVDHAYATAATERTSASTKNATAPSAETRERSVAERPRAHDSASAPDGAGTFKRSEETSRTNRDEARTSQGGFHADTLRDALRSVRDAVAPYVSGRGRAFTYGLAGLAVAVLMLIIGFWPTVLLAAFAAIGVAIGRYRDGDARMQKMAANLTARIGR